MRNLPRLPKGASEDEKIRIIYDWLYELQMELTEILRPEVQNDLEREQRE